ncbi:hypothetical protein O0544_20740 [Edwardsiella anguillarum]|nr:hypothetical protein [Edwardsiella anguillarum]
MHYGKSPKIPADSARQRQIQRIVADVITLLPLLRAGQPNPQFDGKSWRQWSADRLRDRAAAFCPPGRDPHIPRPRPSLRRYPPGHRARLPTRPRRRNLPRRLNATVPAPATTGAPLHINRSR